MLKWRKNMKLFRYFILFLMITFNLSFAIDELMLYGKVKDYNPKTKEIVISVENSSCEGEKVFIIDSSKNLQRERIINKKINFVIDSSECIKNEKYKIIEYFMLED
jgi:hypothetical protein